MRRVIQNLKSINFTELFLQLAIVFIGVYLAFVLSNYQQNRQLVKEGERVIAIMKVGIDRYEKLFEGFVLRHEELNAEFKARLDQQEIPNFARTYYPAPQYPIDVINYLLTRESYKVFPLEVYVSLTGFANAVQRLMYVEEKLVSLAEAYEPLPESSDVQYNRIASQQRLHAERYLNYLETRKNISQELVNRARALREELDTLRLLRK